MVRIGEHHLMADQARDDPGPMRLLSAKGGQGNPFRLGGRNGGDRDIINSVKHL